MSYSMNVKISAIFLLILFSSSSFSETFSCTIKSHVKTNDDGEAVLSASKSIYFGNKFKVSVITGDIEGGGVGNMGMPNRAVHVVDPGMAVNIVTTRGGAFGYLTDLLVIDTWVKSYEKPFDYYISGFGYFTGLCNRL